MKSVSIVIPNWNGRELLADYFGTVVAAAEHFRSSASADIEIVVVDDASTDESVVWLRENYTNNELVRLVELNENVGFVRAVNRGFEAAKYEVVCLLNNDVSVEPDCIAPLATRFETEDVFAVCCRAGRINSERLDGGGKIGRFERGFWRVFLNYEALQEETASELISFYGSGGYSAYSKKKWDKLGGFQDLFAPIYWEDVDICYRAWKRGWKVIYEPRSNVFHLGSATMKKSSRTRLNVITERNRLLMTWINLHDRRMMASHVFWLAVKFAGAAVSFKWNYLRSIRAAWGLISKVKALRGIEKKAALVSDRELADKFRGIAKQKGIYIMENEADELAFTELKNCAKLGLKQSAN